ncbi:NAD(P)H-dependent oxidoreductase subunit E [Phaeovibrio sulfidiphilus]|uniref:NAD(P)H-dependent oxidoreductase subunit E n=1 Tax=Phaeovibrio sulfidiphilus TaxID=1220600 RepID=A0A8J7CDK4_9PROT|nr:NAD(P)H-dependent oxidoreductase subunit E [Phaeovibrio sulfidiphilus]MBE1237084.1 NAD(P)H-dependent oxidoreductase subunit E [Phaeovibrio sulfidiphilus]
MIETNTAAAGTAPFAFTPENQAEARSILARYPKGREHSAALPLLDLAQRQQGYVDRSAMEAVAGLTGLAPIRILEVATFYTMFRHAPVGEHHFEVCTNISCWLRGSDEVLRALRDELGLDPGGKSDDGKFSVQECECLGACVNAPAVRVGDHYFEDLTYDNTVALIRKLRAGEKVVLGSQTGRVGSANAAGATALAGRAS